MPRKLTQTPVAEPTKRIPRGKTCPAADVRQSGSRHSTQYGI